MAKRVHTLVQTIMLIATVLQAVQGVVAVIQRMVWTARKKKRKPSFGFMPDDQKKKRK